MGKLPAIRAKHFAQLDHQPDQDLLTDRLRPVFCCRLLVALFYMRGSTEPVARWRETWMKVNYLIAISFATVGWLWFIIWIVIKVF